MSIEMQTLIFKDPRESDFQFEYDYSIWGDYSETVKKISFLRKYQEETVDGSIGENFSSLTHDLIHSLTKLSMFESRIVLFSTLQSYVTSTLTNSYKKLWKKLSETESWMKGLDVISEMAFYSNEKVRYGGLAYLDISDLDDAIGFLLKKNVSSIFLLPSNLKEDYSHLLEKIMKNCVPNSTSNNQHVLNLPAFVDLISSIDGGVIRPFGGVDYGGAYVDFYFKKNSKFINISNSLSEF